MGCLVYFLACNCNWNWRHGTYKLLSYLVASAGMFVMVQHWLRPPVVAAPAPENRGRTAFYVVSDHYLDCHGTAFRHSPVFWAWAHVVGDLPPINNIGRVNRGPDVPTLTTLEDSVACFRGVKRPYDEEAAGESILVYILNPTVTLEYVWDLVCLAKSKRVPSNTCLTVQVKPLKQPLRKDNRDIEGVVTRLEFVPGNGGEPALPKKFEDRYGDRLWRSS
jgi:hypothetical protein